MRKDIAEKYLKDRNISIDEIAYILGFSETSAFHRAFKSWTGLTPLQFKKSALKY
jgi:AraC-like DNA-binding protein